MFELMIGHIIGDYFLQSKQMALSKIKNNISSWMYCLFHCFIYMSCICLCTANLNIGFLLLIFISHFIIDKFSIAERWLQIINGRSLYAFINENKNQTMTAIDVIQGSFSTLVYTVIDNTLHIIILYFGYIYFG